MSQDEAVQVEMLRNLKPAVKVAGDDAPEGWGVPMLLVPLDVRDAVVDLVERLRAGCPYDHLGEVSDTALFVEAFRHAQEMVAGGLDTSPAAWMHQQVENVVRADHSIAKDRFSVVEPES